MKILITGGAGYLGRSVAMMLQQAGHMVRIFDNGMFGKIPSMLAQSIEVMHGDLRKFEDCLTAVGDQEILVHLAEVGPREAAEADPFFSESCNILGTKMLSAAMSRSAIQKVIIGSWLGSTGNESDSLHGHLFASHCRHRWNLPVTNLYVLQFPELFGAYPIGRLRFDTVPNCYLARAISEGEVAIPRELNRNILSVVDASFAIKTVIDKTTGVSSRDYWFDVGHEELSVDAQSMKDVIEELVPNCTVHIVQEAIKEKEKLIGDFGSFREQFGWTPSITLRQGAVDIRDILTTLPAIRWTDPLAHNVKLVRQICRK